MALSDCINSLKRYALNDIGPYLGEKRELDPDGPVYGSECEPGLHLAMFDVDIDAMLVPSRTPGHWHLYFDRRLTWRQYKKLMKAMAAADIIDRKWVSANLSRKQSFLRVPGAS